MENSLYENKQRKRTFVDFLFLVYIAVTTCNDASIVVRGGFIILMAFTFLQLFRWPDEKKIIIPSYCFVLLNFVAYNYASQMWAWYPNLVMTQFTSLAAGIIMCFIMVNYFMKTKSVGTILNVIAVSGIALGVYVIITYGGLSSFYEQATTHTGHIESTRLGREVANPNFIGMITAYSFIVLLYFALYKKKRMCYLLLIIPFLVMAASGSRKALLIIIIGFILLVYLKQNKEQGIVKVVKLLCWGIIAFAVISALLNLEIMETVKERMETFFNLFSDSGGKVDGSSLARKRMIETGINQIKETPLFGIGLGNGAALCFFRMGNFAYLHNDFIEMAVNNGIVGLVLYYSVIITLLNKHVKLMKKYNDPEIIISFIILFIFMLMNIAQVTYYGIVATYVYMTLWISTVEIYERRGKDEKIIGEDMGQAHQNRADKVSS